LRRSGAQAGQDKLAERAVAGRRREEWWPFARIVLVSGLQSGIVTGLFIYLPLYLVSGGTSPGLANLMSTLLLAVAAVGTLAGGRIADRFGRRWVLIAPMLALVPLIAVVPSLGVLGLIPVIVVIGFLMDANLSLVIVLAQEYLPERIGLASGMTVGVSIGMGGLVAALLGLLGEATGPSTVLYVVAAMPILAAAVSASLPRPGAQAGGVARGGRHPRFSGGARAREKAPLVGPAGADRTDNRRGQGSNDETTQQARAHSPRGQAPLR
jgi:FSR family fosmidomycin resistance protein-like MFS transporter